MRRGVIPHEFLRDGRAPQPKSMTTSIVMSANRGKNTRPEIELRRTLWHQGLRGYRLHERGLPGTPDIVYGRYRLAIFVHGCFWHRCPRCKLPLPKSHTAFWKEKFRMNKIRDRRNQRALVDAGWNSLEVWECEIRTDLSKVISRIQCLLAS